jgi:DNA mismatch repair protein MutS
MAEQLFESLLWEKPAGIADSAEADGLTVSDLRLDQVVDAAARDSEEPELVARLLRQQVSDIGTLRYRHEIFDDLEDSLLFEALKAFTGRIREVRGHLEQLTKMRSPQQRQGWFLDAAAIYRDG